MAQFDLTGQVAVVTGAAGLLGTKHCQALAAAGAGIVCLDLDPAAATALAERLAAEYRTDCLGVGCDVREQMQVEQALAAVMQRYGRVDALVNNARWVYRPEELKP